jgi:hypothetical protein
LHEASTGCHRAEEIYLLARVILGNDDIIIIRVELLTIHGMGPGANLAGPASQLLCVLALVHNVAHITGQVRA